MAEVVCEMSADFKHLPEVSPPKKIILDIFSSFIFHVLHYCIGPFDKGLSFSVQITLILCSCQHSSSRGFEVTSAYRRNSSVFLYIIGNGNIMHSRADLEYDS